MNVLTRRAPLNVCLLALALFLSAAGCVTRTTRTTYVPAPASPPPAELLASEAPSAALAGSTGPVSPETPAAAQSTQEPLVFAAESPAPEKPEPGSLPSSEEPSPGPTQPPAPAGESALDEQYLRAQLASEQKAQLEQVRQRISYPDELSGGALIKSAQKPGEVTLFYPLRAVGAVSVDLDPAKRTVKITPPNDAAIKPLTDTLAKYLDPEKESVAWYPVRNMLEIHALEENVTFILDLLEFLDAPNRQVIIEARIWELTDAQDSQLGSRVNVAKRTGSGSFFNMFDTRFDAQAFIDTLTSGRPYEGSVLEFVTAADANHAHLDIVLQLLKGMGHADLLSQPRMRVTTGHTARIMTGEQVPIQTAKVLLSGSEITTTYKDVGVQLYVTPTIVAPDAITVDVLPTVSEVVGYSDPGPTGISNPIIATREAQTQVTVANGELISIGGLDQIRKTITETKVPLLGDIPLLGYLFKSRRENTKQVRLQILIQPTIAGTESRIVIPELITPAPAAPVK